MAGEEGQMDSSVRCPIDKAATVVVRLPGGGLYRWCSYGGCAWERHEIEGGGLSAGATEVAPQETAPPPPSPPECGQSGGQLEGGE